MILKLFTVLIIRETENISLFSQLLIKVLKKLLLKENNIWLINRNSTFSVKFDLKNDYVLNRPSDGYRLSHFWILKHLRIQDQTYFNFIKMVCWKEMNRPTGSFKNKHPQWVNTVNFPVDEKCTWGEFVITVYLLNSIWT